MQKKLPIKSIILFVTALLLFVVGICFVRTGYDKKDNYYQSEYSWGTNINAYVGGDAYNYIINGTYFAGYCTLGGAMFVAAIIAGVAGVAYFDTAKEDTRKENVSNEAVLNTGDSEPQAESSEEG